MESFGVYLVNAISGETFHLNPKEENIVGRGLPGENPLATISLPHPAISKEHARIKLDPSTHRWVFYNLSRNGSQINNEVVWQSKELQHADQISFASFQLIFYEKFHPDGTTRELPVMDQGILRPNILDDWGETSSSSPHIETIAIVAFLIILVLLLVGFFLL